MVPNDRQPTVLVADNDPDHLARYVAWLKSTHDFGVLEAPTMRDVDELLTSHYPDMLVIDVRMIDDEDDYDESGLTKGLDIAQTGLPVLILTSWPNFEFVRRAATRFPHSVLEGVNFIGKNESQQTFLNLVRNTITNDDVFIVHGRDHAARYMVQSFIQELKLQPRVLDDEPNLGDTIIEKLERYSSSRYVIVIMTGDDIGGLFSDPGDQQRRARQNVVFELGYFMAKRGRHNVALLLEQDVPEGPVNLFSDIYGIVYIPMREGGDWRQRLVLELKHAGFHISWP